MLQYEKCVVVLSRIDTDRGIIEINKYILFDCTCHVCPSSYMCGVKTGVPFDVFAFELVLVSLVLLRWDMGSFDNDCKL